MARLRLGGVHRSRWISDNRVGPKHTIHIWFFFFFFKENRYLKVDVALEKKKSVFESCENWVRSCRTPLDWTTRLKFAAGAARGLFFIHHSCRSPKLTHGNIKSTNILIDNTGNACVSDFGLSAFAPPTTAPKSNGYRAPELLTIDPRKTTQKSDVYSFGVLLLELLTGKCPSVVDNGGTGYVVPVDLPRWVQSVVREEWTAEVFDLELMRYKDIEEEMVAMLQIALSCTAAAPNQRPTMGYVLKMIEEIRGVEVSPSHETLYSVSDSPSVSSDTCRASE
ncbi:putative protein kinase RLK-Pelle-LRR-III family [Helianthus anomalus]